MRHRLILFTGAGPGAGKSTLSFFLAQQFSRSGLPSRWIYEEDTVDVFLPFFQALRNQQPTTIEVFLQATTAFVAECLSQKTVCIVDSLLPGYGFFFGTHSPATIAALSVRLNHILAPLQLLLIYVDSDVAAALNRAIAQRGRAWFEHMVQRMNTWYLPLYPNTPFTDRESVVGFDEAARQVALTLFEQWQGSKLILNTNIATLDQLKAQLLDYFHFAEQPPPSSDEPHHLSHYCGIYQSTTTEPPVEIKWVDGRLIINRYWPNGTALVPENEQQFRLENTNYRVVFENLGSDTSVLTLFFKGSSGTFIRKTQ